MRILGIDPGLERIGYGLVDRTAGTYSAVDFGCFHTSKTDSIYTRLESIYQQVFTYIQTHKPNVIACEQLFFFKNNKTIISVGEARGVILLAVAHANIPLVEPTPLQVKTALTSWGHAPKQQVQAMVARIFKLTHIPTSDDAADALAIAYCGAGLYTNSKHSKQHSV